MSIDDARRGRGAAALRPVAEPRPRRSATSPRTTPTASRTRRPAAGYALRVHRARLPHRAADRVRARSGSTRCARTARSTRCVPVPAPGGERVVVSAVGRRAQRRAVRVAARRRARPRGRRRDRRLPHARRGLRAHARARARVDAARRRSTARRGTTTTRSAPAATGARWQDGLGMGARGARAAAAASTRRSARAAGGLRAGARPLRPRPRRHPPRQPARRRRPTCA